METMITGKQIRNGLYLLLCTCLLVVIVQMKATAQPPVKIYTIKNGRMYIELSKSLNATDLEDFIKQFNLSELALKRFINENFTDSIKNHGWKIDKNGKDFFAISKPLL